MRLDGRIKGELRQGLGLGQAVQQALHLAGLGPDELFAVLKSEAEANPFLKLQLPRRGAPASAAPPPEPEAHVPGLAEHVLRQVSGLVARPEDHRLAQALIEELDATGYLLEDPALIARRCGVAPARMEAVLQAMRRAEPAGLFARDLADCLALQLEEAGALTPEFHRLLGRLPMVASGDRQELARQCGVSPARLAEMLAHLRRLDPRPGAAFGWQPAPRRIAELLVDRTAEGWEVRLNPDAQPRLALDEGLRSRLSGRLPPDLAGAWSRAQQLAGAFDLRNRSLLAVGRAVVAHQAAALDGEPAALAPLTRRTVAAEIGLHETTVGRIVRHSSALVEGRTVALSQFFGRPSAQEPAQGGVSRQRLLALIADCIEAHRGQTRLTDGAITAWLAERQVILARRTVAKYRPQVLPGRPPAG